MNTCLHYLMHSIFKLVRKRILAISAIKVNVVHKKSPSSFFDKVSSSRAALWCKVGRSIKQTVWGAAYGMYLYTLCYAHATSKPRLQAFVISIPSVTRSTTYGKQEKGALMKVQMKKEPV